MGSLTLVQRQAIYKSSNLIGLFELIFQWLRRLIYKSRNLIGLFEWYNIASSLQYLQK